MLRSILHICALLMTFAVLCSFATTGGDGAAQTREAPDAPAVPKESEPTPSLEGRDLAAPGYGIPLDARSPFHPMSAYRASQEPEDAGDTTPEIVLTDAAVQKHIHLDAVVSAGGTTTAIINRSVLRAGESLTVEQQGRTFTLTIESLQTTPPTATLAHEDRRFTVTAGKLRTPSND